MKVTRKFTTQGRDPFGSVTWSERSSRISNPDGSVVFQMDDAEVPTTWSQLATDIMVSKYFRKAGVPEDGGPNGLPIPAKAQQSPDRKLGVPGGNGAQDYYGAQGGAPSDADARSENGPAAGAEGSVKTGPERSAKQVIHRLAGCWRHWGESHGYFATAEDAGAFYDEIVHMMVHQMVAPNSPQWFNTGLNWAYGISGPAQGHYIADHKTGTVSLADDAYTHPQPHACFIQSVDDHLVNEGGIMDLWVREARLFKYGSGTGTNFSKLRAEDESLSGGGKSSGLMSWLRIGDRAAAAIKSGGTTRRAAKMVCLDMDHPDIGDFVNWKVREEIKVQAMVEGLKKLKAEDETIKQTADRLGLNLDYDFNGEAYATVSGQNSNNSIRIPDAFFDAVDRDEDWETYFRTTGEVARTYKARDLWNDINYAAWRCADPGVQYDSTINAWHTCPSAGRINASNPCSEYMFLDNTACNLASLNVLKFYDATTRRFDIERFEHAVDLWTMVLEISVLMASFPSEEIAELSWKYRTLGLGYANLGAMLMQAGIPYDSDEALAVCGCITSLMSGRSYGMSARLAGEHGPFAGFEADRENMLRVIRNHQLAAHGERRDSRRYEQLNIRPEPINHDLIKRGTVNLSNMDDLLGRAVSAWDEAYELGRMHGYRNAQVTVIAPTGTIGLLMDCDTTGVEPDFALVKFKKLAGGGYFKIDNASIRPALAALGYSEDQIRDMLTYIMGTLRLDVAMPAGAADAEAGELLSQWLIRKGLTDADLKRVQDALPSVFELSFAFGTWTLGDEVLVQLGIDAEAAKADPQFNVLRELGLSTEHIDQLNEVICGTQTIEGAPHIKDEHLAVFDCANPCGKTGTRFIHVNGHIKMMAAAQPFISGAISKTINLPHEADIEDIKASYRLGWELGLKANALYRDGCKLSQPLNTKSDAKEEVDLEAEVDELGESMAVEAAADEVAAETADLAVAAARGEREVVIEKEVQIVHRPLRRRLPDTRNSVTHKFNVAGHEGYLTVGLYEDGSPGELFITMAKEGSTIGGLMDSLGTAVSVALQYGVPVESLVSKFTHQRFEPSGMTMNREIPFAKSLVDYIFRWLGIRFIAGYREANTPQRNGTTEPVGSVGSHEKTESTPTTSVETRTEKDRWESSKSEASAGSQDAGPAHGSGGAVVHTKSGVNPQAAPRSVAVESTVGSTTDPLAARGAASAAATLSIAMDSMGDAPACDVCGTITVRSGTCYKCLNCGNSMGCS
jgi:ribonucleoside-diphosphate reductase alpha chain